MAVTCPSSTPSDLLPPTDYRDGGEVVFFTHPPRPAHIPALASLPLFLRFLPPVQELCDDARVADLSIYVFSFTFLANY